VLLVRRRRILGAPSRSLVMNDSSAFFEASSN
jgi:hypothetical protein